MATAGALMIELSANVARLQEDLGRAHREIDGFSRSTEKVFRALGIGIGATLSAAGIAAFVKSAIDMADTVGKAAEKFGMGADSLSALKYAAELGDVAFEGLTKSLKHLNTSMVSGDQAFAAMGIRVKDSSGNLRQTEDVLLDVAGAFASYKDGAAKTAIAVQLFGRAGADMIPLLNQGKAGILEEMDAARKLGVVISTDTAKAAEEFNDNLKTLKTSSSGFAVSLASGVLPLLNGMLGYMNSLVGKMREATEEFNRMKRESGNYAPDIEGVWRGAEEMTGTGAGAGQDTEAGFEFLSSRVKESKKKGAPDIEAWKKAAEEKKRLSDEYTKLHAANMAREGEMVHSTFGDEMGWTQEYHDTLRKLDDESFAEFKKGIEENAALLEKFNMEQILGLRELQDAQRAEFEGDQGPMSPYTAEMAYNAAMAYGDAASAIEQLDNGLLKYIDHQQLSNAQVENYKNLMLDAGQFTSNTLGSMANSLQKFYAAAGSKNTALFRAYQAIAISEAIVSTYTGAARALKEWPWPYSVVVAGIVTAAGMASVATIASQKPAGAAHGGLGYVPSEQTYILDRGERVLSPRQNEDLTDFLGGEGGGGGMPRSGDIYLDGEKFGRWVERRGRQYGWRLASA